MSQMTADERSCYRVTKARPRFRREGLGRVGILGRLLSFCACSLDPARLGWRADGTLTTTHPRHSRRSRTWRRRKAEEFPEDTRNLKAAEELERLAAEIETLEHSEIHQQICDMQERIDRMMTAIFGFGLWSVRPNPRHFARSGFTSATTPDCNFSNGTATCWRKSFRIVSRTLFPPSRYGPSSDKQPNIRTSHLLAPALECSDVRLVGQEARKRVLELRCPVTVPRAIGSLSRMNDDGANIIVSQLRLLSSAVICDMEAEPGGLTYEFHKAGPPRPVANIATVGSRPFSLGAPHFGRGTSGSLLRINCLVLPSQNVYGA